MRCSFLLVVVSLHPISTNCEVFFFFLECNKQTVTPWTLNTANCELHMASSLQGYFFPWFHILLLGFFNSNSKYTMHCSGKHHSLLPQFPSFQGRSEASTIFASNLREKKPSNIKIVWHNSFFFYMVNEVCTLFLRTFLLCFSYNVYKV